MPLFNGWFYNATCDLGRATKELFAIIHLLTAYLESTTDSEADLFRQRASTLIYHNHATYHF